jgi:hypothetical protein
MLRDVISAVTELMVKVLLSEMGIRIYDVAGVEPQAMCDPTSL